MRRLMVALMLLLLLFPMPVRAEDSELNLEEQMEEQLDALGADELLRHVPEEAREYLQEADLFDIDLKKLMELTPGKFFPALGRMFWNTVKRPSRTLAAMLAVILLCALLESLRDTVSEPALSGAFQTVSVLCILTAVATPFWTALSAPPTPSNRRPFLCSALFPCFRLP